MTTPFLSLLQGNDVKQSIPHYPCVEADEEDELVFSRLPSQANAHAKAMRNESLPDSQCRGNGADSQHSVDQLLTQRIHQLFSKNFATYFSRWCIE